MKQKPIKTIEVDVTKEQWEKLKAMAEAEGRSVRKQAAMMLAKLLAFVLIGASLGILAASFTGCSAPLRTEADVLKIWGTPASIIPDSAWHIDHYVSSDKTTNDFGIWDKTGKIIFHNNF